MVGILLFVVITYCLIYLVICIYVFSMSLHGLLAHFFPALNKIPCCGCTTVIYPFIYWRLSTSLFNAFQGKTYFLPFILAQHPKRSWNKSVPVLFKIFLGSSSHLSETCPTPVLPGSPYPACSWSSRATSAHRVTVTTSASSALENDWYNLTVHQRMNG